MSTPAKLPALQPPRTTRDGALDQWIQAVTERMEVREGRRGDDLEKVLTRRDVGGYNLSDVTTFLATTGQGFMQKQQDGSYDYVDATELSEQLRSTALFQALLSGTKEGAEYDVLPQRVQSLVANGISDIRSAQKADFDNLRTQLTTGLSISGGGGASAVWINVKDSPYNAVGDGTADDTAAIQSAINAAQAAGANGNIVYLPAGNYKITSNLIITWPNSTTDFSREGKVYLRGAGSGLTALFDNRASVGTGGCVTLDFSTTGGPGTPDVDLSEHYMFTYFGGFSILKKINFTVALDGGGLPTYPSVGTGVGLYVERVVCGTFVDLIIKGYATAIKLVDNLGGSIRDCIIQEHLVGIDYTGYSAFSQSTATQVDNVTIAGCRDWGIRNVGGSTFTIRDCTIESSGNLSTTSGGIYYQNPDPILMAKGLTVVDCYFESCFGASFIYIDTPTGKLADVANSVVNCVFTKTNGTYFATNYIAVNVVGTTTMELLVMNCGFRGFNSYVPSAARPVVGLYGSTTNVNITYISNKFYDTVEIPAGAELSMGVPARGMKIGATGKIEADAVTLTIGSASNSIYVSSVAGGGNQGLFPSVTNTMMLGGGAFRWSNVVASAANITGIFTWNTYAYAAPTGGTTTFMRNDGTWSVPPSASASADGYVNQVAQTFSGAKTFANGVYLTDVNHAVGQLAAGNLDLIGLTNVRISTGGSSPTVRFTVSAANLVWGGTTIVNPPGGTTSFLRADGTWAAPAGGGGTTTNAVTFNNGGAGAASGSTFNGSAAVTISHNTIGAYAATNPSSYIALGNAITGYSAGANTALAATDTLLAALGKLQGQVTARGTGTVTGVTATAPIVSSGGTAPVISSTAATGAVAGHVTTAAQTFGGQKTFAVAPISSAGYNIDANTAMGITSNYWFATGFTGCQLYVNAVQKYVFEGTLFRPATDNAIACGNGSFRWTTVFAVTGTINTSDVRQKTDIAPETLGLNFITKLNPVSYRWIEGQRIAIDPEPKYDAETGQRIAQEATEVEVRPGERTFHGLLAQEVKSTLDEMGVEDFAGWTLDDKNDPDSRQGLRYTEFIAPLIKAVQELSAQNKALESRVAALELAQ